MKCFTYEQARMIIEDLSSIPIKDSILAKREAQITNLYDQIFSYKSMDSLKQDRIGKLETENTELKEEISKCRKRGKVKTITFTSIGTIVGSVIALLLR